jgi:hypothetical protein
MAPSKARFCEAAHEQRILLRVEMPRFTPPRCRVEGWMFNYAGCVLATVASPGPDIEAAYYHRLLDLDGRMKLASTAIWLRQQKSGDYAAEFERRPTELRDARHRLGGERCTPTLHFTARQPRPRSEPWLLPLPPPAGCDFWQEPATSE